MLVNKTLV